MRKDGEEERMDGGRKEGDGIDVLDVLDGDTPPT